MIVYIDLNDAYLKLPVVEQKLILASMTQSIVKIPKISAIYVTVDGEELKDDKGNPAGIINEDDFVQNNGSSLSSYEETELALYFANESGDKLVKQNVQVKYNTNTSKEKLEEEVRRITNGNGFDVTIEAVGLPSTFQNCIDCAAYGGRVVLIGVGKKNLDFNFTIIQKKELNIFGSRNALKKDFLELIDLVKAGKVDLEKIVTNTYKLDEADKAFKEFSENAGSMLKVVIDFTK